jgi:hypothetical protein
MSVSRVRPPAAEILVGAQRRVLLPCTVGDHPGVTCAVVAFIVGLAVVGVLSPPLAGSESGEREDAALLWSRALAAQRLQSVRGEAVLRTLAASGESTALDIRFMAKAAADGWGRWLVDRVESDGPLRGSSFLTLEQRDAAPSLWVYLPGLGAPRRVTGSNLGDTYLGTEFAYAEFLQPRIDDFDVSLLGPDVVGDTPCWKLEAVPKGGREEGTGYGKREIWLRRDNIVERRVRYYDPAGRPLKVMDVYKVVSAGGASKWIALKRRMHNLRTGQVSVATFGRIETDIEIDGAVFAPQHLASSLW